MGALLQLKTLAILAAILSVLLGVAAWFIQTTSETSAEQIHRHRPVVVAPPTHGLIS